MKKFAFNFLLLISVNLCNLLYGQRMIPDFQVNENIGTTGANQSTPSISVDKTGNFVMVWTDKRNGDSDIYAQRYSNESIALGPNFKVNDDQGGARQNVPSISADESGNFVIVWSDERNGNRDIYAQRYSSDGSALETNFKVNDDHGNGRQSGPSISAYGNGNFIITWLDERDGYFEIYAQRFSGDGTALGTNFKVNDEEGAEWLSMGQPSVSANVSGNFIITWVDDRYGCDIYGQQYSSDGTALGTNFKVNDDQGNISCQRYNPSVSMDDNSNFVIVWTNERNWSCDIYGQRYSSDGTALGTNFRVNDDQGDTEQDFPSISIDSSGNFVIAWTDERNGNCDIYAQRYSIDFCKIACYEKVVNKCTVCYCKIKIFSEILLDKFLLTCEIISKRG